MDDANASGLRRYLRRDNPNPVPEIEIFLEHVGLIFKLRAEAEKNFKSHQAKSRRDALPLDWSAIAAILHPAADTPSETLITRISREVSREMEEIIGGMRKVLIRVRETAALNAVRQVDSHCLRWLSRQPGRDAVEKAGARQRILAVVRRENHNTLENRVFKDFLYRAGGEAALYLRENEGKFPGHATIKQMKKLRRLCEIGLSNPLMEEVGTLHEMPVPNFVLRQGRRYSKIWKAYRELMQRVNIAERLWRCREELAQTLARLKEEAERQPTARFHCPIWFAVLDGKRELLDQPFYDNEFERSPLPDVPPQPFGDDRVIDLTGRLPAWDLLIYSRHGNAKPYLQNYAKPSIEDMGGEHYFLTDLLRKLDTNDDKRHDRLRDYFSQLHARIGGRRWFVLVPDHWDALWQETIIKSVPLARNHVFLLWRSVAVTLGIRDRLRDVREGDTIIIADAPQGDRICLSKLTLVASETPGGLIPQRKSFKRHQELYDHVWLEEIHQPTERDAFLFGKKKKYAAGGDIQAELRDFRGGAHHAVFVDAAGNGLAMPGWMNVKADLLEKGAREFIGKYDRGEIAYYDELEALSLVVQTEDERIAAKPLVEADEKFPGGRTKETPLLARVAVLQRDSNSVGFRLCMGEALPDAPLKTKTHEFGEKLEEDHALDLSARMTPGQGMAVVTVHADFLREPIELDFLHGMEDRGETLFSLEEKLERSFPPYSPDVEADGLLWESVKTDIKDYMSDRVQPEGIWFAKARKKYLDGILPNGKNKLDVLRRINVFGNDPEARYPTSTFNFSVLFNKLVTDYSNPRMRDKKEEIIRLIAWTYQADNPVFKKIVQKTVASVLAYAQGRADAPSYQRLTLCANLCIDPEEWRGCLEAIRLRISNHNNKVSRDFYLLYNLLQFHPTILQNTRLHQNDAFWEWVQHIPFWYKQYNNREQRSTTISYILKSILYFLHCRRFDGKRFLTKEHDPEHYEIISRCLSAKVASVDDNKLRQLVLAYLNGKGTIDDLPMD